MTKASTSSRCQPTVSISASHPDEDIDSQHRSGENALRVVGTASREASRLQDFRSVHDPVSGSGFGDRTAAENDPFSDHKLRRAVRCAIGTLGLLIGAFQLPRSVDDPSSQKKYCGCWYSCGNRADSARQKEEHKRFCQLKELCQVLWWPTATESELGRGETGRRKAIEASVGKQRTLLNSKV